uniref:Uncharacterized protein n=1 Tax=Magallana gigas TaxID=29159 RepID=A0A8W8IRP8_MAGGI
MVAIRIHAHRDPKDDVPLKLGEIRARRKGAMAKGMTLQQMLHEKELDKPNYGRERRRNVEMIQTPDMSSLLPIPTINVGSGEESETVEADDATEENMENIRALFLLNFPVNDDEQMSATETCDQSESNEVVD